MSEKMSWADAREERRTLRQKLFFIRRFMEGHRLKLDGELQDLKKKYEEMPGFTGWDGFPEKWDIGDPNRVREHMECFNDIDRMNIEKILDKPYDNIISMVTKDKE